MPTALQLKNHFHIHYLFQTHARVQSQSFDYHFKDKETEA